MEEKEQIIIEKPESQTGYPSLPEEEPMPRSHRNKVLEIQTKRTLLLTISGILAIFVLLIAFGIPLIIRYSVLIGNVRDGKDTNRTDESQIYIAPPILDPIVTATNSAEIKITGNAVPKLQILLYINDDLAGRADSKEDGNFTFPAVILSEGQNNIKVKAVKKTANAKHESRFSAIEQVFYRNKQPALSIDYPVENQILSGDNRLTVAGKSEPDIEVTVNGYRAIVDEQGRYTYTFPMQNGDNKLKVVATDKAGNKTELERSVIYNP